MGFLSHSRKQFIMHHIVSSILIIIMIIIIKIIIMNIYLGISPFKLKALTREIDNGHYTFKTSKAIFRRGFKSG